MTTQTPTRARIAREGFTCPDCGAAIWRGSTRCQACHFARKRAAPAAAREAPATDGYIRVSIPFTGQHAASTYFYGGGPLDDSGAGGAALTWACNTEREAAVMRAVFAGRVDDVPSRKAFAPMPWEGLAARMAAEDAAMGGAHVHVTAEHEQEHARD